MSEKRESSNVGKIIIVTMAVVAGACAVVWFALKLYRKYCLLECDYADDELDDDLFDENCDCEVLVEDDAREQEPAL